LNANIGDFRIPVLNKEVVIEFPGGAQTAGVVFIPMAAPDHDGFMRLVEWLNGGDEFFPFKARGEEGPLIVNKRCVISLTAYHERDSGDRDEIDDAAKRAVRVETQFGDFEGQLVVDTPYHKHRALDVLNDGKRFIYLLGSGKEIHINKKFITKAVEIESSDSAGTM
jgi:hypothetical protein